MSQPTVAHQPDAASHAYAGPSISARSLPQLISPPNGRNYRQRFDGQEKPEKRIPQLFR
jgi:hypothetical protein